MPVVTVAGSWSGADAVVEVNDAVSESALIEKFELRVDVVRQGALAASHHDRAQEQMALVDQPRADRLAGELGTADRDVGLGGLLELPDSLLIELALDPRRSRLRQRSARRSGSPTPKPGLRTPAPSPTIANSPTTTSSPEWTSDDQRLDSLVGAC
jgi:hypothetical protein